MAKKDRDHKGGEQLNVADDLMGDKVATLGESGPESSPENSAVADAGATSEGPKVDTETGEISGKGFEAPPTHVIETVALPNKIVAKEIILRKDLKGGKTWVPGRDKKGELLNDGSGEWVLDPPRKLYTVFGTASGTRTGSSTYGDWILFTGNFEAVRESDGKRFKSAELVLQGAAETLLLDALQSIKTDDKNASVNFAFNVGLKTSQRWADSGEGTTYEYTMESVINVERSDPLAHMRQALSGILPKPAQKVLEAPSKS
jgi:hypothetical protein